MTTNKHISIGPVAGSVPYDDAAVLPLLNADDVQAAIDALKNKIATAASPGFTWGRSGNVNKNAWLQNDTVPSNTAGRLIGLGSAKLERAFLANENVSTYSLEIYEHDGVTFTLLATVTNTAARTSFVDFIPPISVTTGRMLGVKVSSGSGKNMVFGLVLSGVV